MSRPPPPPPPPPPRHTPWDLQFFLSWRSIRHPELLIDLIYIFCYIFLIHIKAKRHVFTTFMSVFLSFLEKDIDVIMKMKTKKKNSLKSASLIEHFMRTLDRISVSLYISKALYLFSYKNLSLFKAKLKEYSVHGFIPLQPLSDKFLRFSLKISSLEVRSHRVNHARNNTNFAKSKRR